eukprot:CAMPEP_0197183678 /NCGR_PEP_ID=MMETSP1423-20130617/7965_1 /TAXON_ID=476441 /ORGANISM="Pseudo-nitzschia heimii, Strain UNC1101" /LENGTH=175 /DNA_ID=CAMNT_0042634279 /DNA_START=36 /DNA_END=563 /DNA_ORIENTATION=+
MIHRNNDLATKALKMIEHEGMNQPSRKRVAMNYASAGDVRCSNSSDKRQSAPLKRSRSRSALSASFDMKDFLRASEEVEETIAFPTIEWPSFDDDDDSSSSDGENSYGIASMSSRRTEEREDINIRDDEDDESFDQYPRKRQCRGLTRCSKSCNLSSLWDISNRSERRGSNGSLS